MISSPPSISFSLPIEEASGWHLAPTTVKDGFRCCQCLQVCFEKVCSPFKGAPSPTDTSTLPPPFKIDTALTESVLVFSLLPRAELQPQSTAHLCVIQEAIMGFLLWTSKGGGRMKDDHYPTIPLLSQTVHRSLMLQVTGLENGWELPSATRPACLPVRATRWQWRDPSTIGLSDTSWL